MGGVCLSVTCMSWRQLFHVLFLFSPKCVCVVVIFCFWPEQKQKRATAKVGHGQTESTGRNGGKSCIKEKGNKRNKNENEARSDARSDVVGSHINTQQHSLQKAFRLFSSSSFVVVPSFRWGLPVFTHKPAQKIRSKNGMERQTQTNRQNSKGDWSTNDQPTLSSLLSKERGG